MQKDLTLNECMVFMDTGTVQLEQIARDTYGSI